MSEDSQFAIIVSSCDAYSDAWEPFFTLLFRYWSDCPYAIYLLTESKTYPDKRVISLNIPNLSWATRLKEALCMVSHPYILYLQEDYFLKQIVDSKRIRELFDIFEKEKVASLRLYPNPAPNKTFKNYTEVGIVKSGTPYRLSLQATIWDKNIFQQLLVNGDDPWNTEHEGSKRSNNIDRLFLSVVRNSLWSKNVSPVFEYVCTGISKRLWTWDAIYLFHKEEIKADLTTRGTETYMTYIRRRLQQVPYIGQLFYFLYRIEYKIKTMLRSD